MDEHILNFFILLFNSMFLYLFALTSLLFIGFSFEWIKSIIIDNLPSFLILAFTIYSFYYLNRRKGKLVVSSPISYAIVKMPKNDLGEGLWLELPLVFYNDGAATQFIQNMRLILQQNKSNLMKFDFDAIYKELPWSGLLSDKRTYEIAHQFVVEGHKAYYAIFAFGSRPIKFTPSEGVCKVRLEAKINGSNNWEKISNFNIIIWKLTVNNLDILRPYSNDPDTAPENAEELIKSLFYKQQRQLKEFEDGIIKEKS